MDGNALEVAIALWRSPTRRVALRQGRLPADVGEVIELTAGAPERLAQAAARTGERPEQLLEAVRFYVREVLLFDGADAYRVLGVPGHAEHARIKAHHRALQHWLHPDRRGDDWESIYATRINAAWAELRSPERRAAYDARAGSTGHAVAAAPHRVLVSGWRAAPAAKAHWPGWVAVGAAVAACLWLAVLVDRQASAPAPEWEPARSDPADREPGPRPQAHVDPATPAPDQPRPTPVAFTPGPPVRAPAQYAAIAPLASLRGRAQPAPATRAQASVPPLAARTSLAAAPPPALVAAIPPAPAAMPMPPRSPSQSSSRSPSPSPAQSPAQSPPRAAGTAPAVRAPLAAPLPAPELDPGRVRLAVRRGSEVTDYLTSSSGHVPPIWRSVAAQDAAASIRERLDDGQPRRTRRLRLARFGQPAWQIAPDRATMTATVDGGAAGTASLRVGLGWRDGMWLVEWITLDPWQ